MTRVMILGCSGMLGNAMLRVFASESACEATGTVRSERTRALLPASIKDKVHVGVDVENIDSLIAAYAAILPDVVINCVGVVKQLASANDPLTTLPINSMLPHRLSRLCEAAGARLIHVSTDCVFSGKKGQYVETDFPDANDLYGRSKLLGEVTEAANAVTLRTSIIGHELNSANGLVGWFLSQKGMVRGFRKAVFSGLPTVELSRLIRDHVLPNENLSGLYHVAADPINKYELLETVSRIYGKEIKVEPDDALIIDRSLDSSRFNAATGYRPAPWPDLISRMHDFG